MRRNCTSLALLALFLGCRAPVPSRAQPVLDDGLGELVRTMVTDSLIGGGRRAGLRYVAADSASDSMLRPTGLNVTRRESARELPCPSSTDTAGLPVAREVGHVVRVDRAQPIPGILRLGVTVSCAFFFRGEQRGFAQGSIWELRHVEGRWRVTGTLGRWIT